MEFSSELWYRVAMFIWFVWVLSMIDAVRYLHTNEFDYKVDVWSAIGISVVYIFILAELWIEELYYNFKSFKYWKWAYSNPILATIFELVVVFLIVFMCIWYFIWVR